MMRCQFFSSFFFIFFFELIHSFHLSLKKKRKQLFLMKGRNLNRCKTQSLDQFDVYWRAPKLLKKTWNHAGYSNDFFENFFSSMYETTTFFSLIFLSLSVFSGFFFHLREKSVKKKPCRCIHSTFFLWKNFSFDFLIFVLRSGWNQLLLKSFGALCMRQWLFFHWFFCPFLYFLVSFLKGGLLSNRT